MNSLEDSRKREIVNACLQLYENHSFKEITIKDISKKTSFSRPSIYNYFETKEEIFLEIFKEEYDSWNFDLEIILNEAGTMQKSEFADKIAKSLENRVILLKILSMNLYDMEENSRLNNLTNFKLSYAKSIKLFEKLLTKYFGYSEKDANDFFIIFYSFLAGVYPYTHITKKQDNANKNANLIYCPISIYNLVYKTVFKLI